MSFLSSFLFYVILLHLNNNLMKCRIFILFLFFFVVTTQAQIQQEKSAHSIHIIKPQQLEGLTITELQLLKDEIYARHGYTFSNDQKTNYFLQYSWYNPVRRNSLIELNEIEKSNIKLIDDKIIQTFEIYNKYDSSDKFLSTNEVEQILTPKVKKYLEILFYNIRYIYKYKNGERDNYVILAENQYNDYNDSRPIYNNYLKLLFCIGEKDFLLKRYDISDLIDTRAGEFDIRFLPKYFHIEDIDKDGIIEPIIIYGAMGEKGYRDGWIKIVIKYKYDLHTIIINSSSASNEKSISLTSGFYFLPNSIQQKVISILEKIERDDLIDYPENWKEEFKRHETLIW